MDKLVRDVFDDVCKDLKIDKTLIRKLEKYQMAFISKNADHAEFFGGNLTGTKIVRFTENDKIKWYDEILNIDEFDVADRCSALIDPVLMNVAGNVMNLSCVWLAHAFRRSKLPEKDIRHAQVIIMEIMQYKFLTSRMFRHWRYPAKVETAEATLAAMSNKFLIKQKNSWNGVLRARALDITDPKNSIHKEALAKMDIDIRPKGKKGYSTVYLINDTQNRIRDMLKNIYNLFLQVHNAGDGIKTKSGSIELDGEMVMRDKIMSQEIYRQYLSRIITDKKTFIKTELVEIITSAMSTMPPNLFLTSLEYISDNYANQSKDSVDELIDQIMTHALTYLSANKDVMKSTNDVTGLLSRMKGVYTSSRSTDPDLLEIRKKLESLVTKATKNKSPAVVAATRTGILLYILLRTFSMNYYRNK